MGALTEQGTAMGILRAAYLGDVEDAHSISVDIEGTYREVDKATGYNGAGIYGEILPHSVVRMLRRLGAAPGQKYYDLGSGFGKSVVLAWALGLDATGIELATERHAAACEAVGRLRHGHAADKLRNPRGLRLLHSNFLDADVSDADIVFTDNLEFPAEMRRELARVVRKARPGTRVVSSAGLPGLPTDFTMVMPASWAYSTDWVFQTVGGPSNRTSLQAARGPPSRTPTPAALRPARRLLDMWRRGARRPGRGGEEMTAKSITRPAAAGRASSAGGAPDACELAAA